VKDRAEGPGAPTGLQPTAHLNHEKHSVVPSEGQRDRVNRRGFLGQVGSMLGAAFAGIWSLASPRRGGALIASSGSQGQYNPEFCGKFCSPPPPPPPPPNYTAQSEALINNLVAAFNAHNVTTCMSYFNSAYMDTAAIETHLENTFSAFPAVQCTVSSTTAGPYGEYVTIAYDLPGEYQVVVRDDAVEADDVQPVQSDTVSGSQTFYILSGSSIYSMTGTNNLVTVFAAHGATVV